MGSNGGGRRVLVIGDSLTVACEDELLAAATGVDLRISAEIGRRIRAALAILGGAGEVTDVVVALGSNDYNLAPPSISVLIDEVVAAAAAVGEHVWWVDLAITGGRDVAWNEALDDTARSDTRLHLLRWSRCVAGSEASLLAEDGVHLTVDGCAARAQLIAAEVWAVPAS